MSTITLTKSDGAIDVNFSPSESDGNKKKYIDKASGLTEPKVLEIDHILRPVGAKGTDRHIFKLSQGDVDDTDSEFTLAYVKVEIGIPRKPAFTDAVVKDLVKMMVSYIGRDANVVDLKAGVTPEGDYNVTGPFVPQ